MNLRNLCVLGGSGFVGRHLLALLAARGYRVTVPTGRRESAKHLLVLPTVEVVEADIHDPDTLRRLFDGVDAVINLVGILHQRAPHQADDARARRGSFQHAHVELPRKVVQACVDRGVPRLLHMSALGAQIDARSAYQRSKGMGEALVLDAGMQGSARADRHLAVTVFRPSVVFGPGDSFLSLFARLLRVAPVVPLAGAHARFQPVYVGDVARAFADALDNRQTFGQRYDLCGPKVYTLQQLVELTARALGLRRVIVPLGEGASYAFARLMELKPGTKIMTRDNHYAMLTDNVCDEQCPYPFGTPTALDSVIGYLREDGPRRDYDGYRAHAGR